MTLRFTRRHALAVTAGITISIPSGRTNARQSERTDRLVVTNSTGNTITRIDPWQNEQVQYEVGFAPWAIAARDDIAWVSTAEGLVRFDLKSWQATGLFPYQTPIEELTTGEYRPGGMGLAISSDSALIHVGVYRYEGVSIVESFLAKTGEVIATYEVGVRPFQLLTDPESGTVYSIDHDSYTVTVIDPSVGATFTVPAAPLGDAGFDKPHYATFDGQRRLILPYQGVLTARLDPLTGEMETYESAANTHQHGIARIPDTDTYVIVGTGPAGRATGGPNLAIVDLATGEERIIPLDLPHEDIALSEDGGYAILTGGYSFANGGWDGISAVDLDTGEVTSWEVPNRPLGILRVESGAA